MELVKKAGLALVMGCLFAGVLAGPVAADDVIVDGNIITAENYDSASSGGTEQPDDVAIEEPEEEEITVRIPIRVKHGE